MEGDYNSDIASAAKSVLEKLLDLMGVPATVELLAEAPFPEDMGGGEKALAFDVKGDDLGILIGRRGQTLACLQYIVRLIVTQQTKSWVPIIVDIEGYRRRRYESLQALAWRMAEQVKAKRMPFALEPMPAFDRRVIHLSLADHPEVTTQSTGEGESRRVVILPKEKLV